jgi:hypothetical protein
MERVGGEYMYRLMMMNEHLQSDICAYFWQFFGFFALFLDLAIFGGFSGFGRAEKNGNDPE